MCLYRFNKTNEYYSKYIFSLLCVSNFPQLACLLKIEFNAKS